MMLSMFMLLVCIQLSPVIIIISTNHCVVQIGALLPPLKYSLTFSASAGRTGPGTETRQKVLSNLIVNNTLNTNRLK